MNINVENFIGFLVCFRYREPGEGRKRGRGRDRGVRQKDRHGGQNRNPKFENDNNEANDLSPDRKRNCSNSNNNNNNVQTEQSAMNTESNNQTQTMTSENTNIQNSDDTEQMDLSTVKDKVPNNLSTTDSLVLHDKCPPVESMEEGEIDDGESVNTSVEKVTSQNEDLENGDVNTNSNGSMNNVVNNVDNDSEVVDNEKLVETSPKDKPKRNRQKRGKRNGKEGNKEVCINHFLVYIIAWKFCSKKILQHGNFAVRPKKI